MFDQKTASAATWILMSLATVWFFAFPGDLFTFILMGVAIQTWIILAAWKPVPGNGPAEIKAAKFDQMKDLIDRGDAFSKCIMFAQTLTPGQYINMVRVMNEARQIGADQALKEAARQWRNEGGKG